MTDFTRTDIVNLALRELGAGRIDAWDEDQPEAVIARDLWTQAVRKALARHEWQFAIKSVELARSTVVPSTRFAYRYTLPGDVVRIGAVSEFSTMQPRLDMGTGWAQRDGSIDSSAASVFLEYVYDAPVIGTWAPWFVDVMVADYASVMASPLKSTTERERLEQLAEKRLREGRGIDSVQKPQRQVFQSGWRSAARGAWR